MHARLPIQDNIGQIKWQLSIARAKAASRMVEFQQRRQSVNTIDFGINKLKAQLRPLKKFLRRMRREVKKTQAVSGA